MPTRPDLHAILDARAPAWLAVAVRAWARTANLSRSARAWAA